MITRSVDIFCTFLCGMIAGAVTLYVYIGPIGRGCVRFFGGY